MSRTDLPPAIPVFKGSETYSDDDKPGTKVMPPIEDVTAKSLEPEGETIEEAAEQKKKRSHHKGKGWGSRTVAEIPPWKDKHLTIADKYRLALVEIDRLTAENKALIEEGEAANGRS